MVLRGHASQRSWGSGLALLLCKLTFLSNHLQPSLWFLKKPIHGGGEAPKGGAIEGTYRGEGVLGPPRLRVELMGFG